MSQEKTTLEIIAPTTEEAINRGLEQLGLPAESVNIEILDSGSKGLLGIGGRQARVRLSLKTEEIESSSEEISMSEVVKKMDAQEISSLRTADETSLSDDEKKAIKAMSE